MLEEFGLMEEGEYPIPRNRNLRDPISRDRIPRNPYFLAVVVYRTNFHVIQYECECWKNLG